MGLRVEIEDPKEWNPHCPKCQEELKRLVELSQSVYDDVDHGATSYQLTLPVCTHRPVQDPRGRAGGGA